VYFSGKGLGILFAFAKLKKEDFEKFKYVAQKSQIIE
jgi:hypothetical protein